MRISVWSSDVCSSDLAGVDRPWIGRLIVLLHLAEEDLLEICHFGLWNLSHRRFDVAVISLGVDFLHGLNLGDLLLSGSRFGRFAVAAAHKDKRRGNCDERSEEHTSALQSLMRISYAVFCVKKK